MRRRLLLPFVALLFASFTTSLLAEGEPPFVPNVLPSLDVRRTAGTITLDGELDDPGWQGAARADNFAENMPRDNVKPPVDTEVLVTYDDENLYLGFICHDDPSTIRATMHDRDTEFSEDWVGIILDTFGDAAWAYEIYATPLGIQGDLRWSGNDEDVGFNLVYSAESKITANGWQVEMAIPFSSLRFPDRAQQTWRATFWRIHPRASRSEYSWAAISRDNPCMFCQFGYIRGIENVKPGGSLDLLPAVVASQSGRSNGPGGGLTHEYPSVEFSLGARYALSTSLVAEASVNPDFSQIESDETKIDVNNTFALFYPERRPFFQEGSDLFMLPNGGQPAIYTRTINDPLVAARLTGRMGRTSIAYIGALDEQTVFLLPFPEQSIFAIGGKSISNIVRFKQTFGASSYAGAFLTDRRIYGGGSGTAGGLDGQARFLDNYRLEWQAMASHTAEPNDANLSDQIEAFITDPRDSVIAGGKYTSAFDGESFMGTGLYVRAARDARFYSANIDYTYMSPTFRVPNGFVTQNDFQRIGSWHGLTFYPETNVIDKISTNVGVGRVWTTEGVQKEDWMNPSINLQLKAQTNVDLSASFTNEKFRGIEFTGLQWYNVNVNSNFSNPVRLGAWFGHGKSIARFLRTPVVGTGTDYGVSGTFKPISQLSIQPSFNYSRLDDPEGNEIYAGYVLRTRFSYQFTRELFLRLVAEYNDFSGGLAIQPLLTYKINPFTIFYVGSSHTLADFDRRDSRAIFNQVEQVFFAKFQYLYQM